MYEYSKIWDHIPRTRDFRLKQFLTLSKLSLRQRNTSLRVCQYPVLFSLLFQVDRATVILVASVVFEGSPPLLDTIGSFLKVRSSLERAMRRRRAPFVSFLCVILLSKLVLAHSVDDAIKSKGHVIPQEPPRGVAINSPRILRGVRQKKSLSPNIQKLDSSLDASSIFIEAPSYASGGNYASSVAVADFNKDGKPDIVVSNTYASNTNNGTVGVLLGNGDGSFQAVVAYNSGGVSSIAVAVADVNGDGNLDIIVANECASTTTPMDCEGSGTDGTVGVLLGNGDGTFQPVIVIDSGGLIPAAVGVADLNADGKPDIVVTNECPIIDVSYGTCTNYDNGVVTVLLGNGDGSFQPPVSYYSGGQRPDSVVLADLNGDGKLDIAVANYCPKGAGVEAPCQAGSSSSIGILLGNGDGTFGSVADYNSGGYYSTSIAAGDVNGDGKLDLVVASESDYWPDFENGAVAILLGNGDGTFEPPTPYTFVGYGESAEIADVNGDGALDLVVSNGYGVGIFLASGKGTFQSMVTYGSGGDSFAIADINGDGKPDLLVANECASVCTTGTVGILLGTGTGGFRTIVTYGSGGFVADSVVAADVNGDGKPDVVVASRCASNTNGTCVGDGTVGLLIGIGDGTFQMENTYGSGGYQANAIAVADLNDDGKGDIIVLNLCADSSCATNGTVSVLLGNGDGTFQTALTYDAGGSGSGIAVGDVNGDHKLDLLVANSYGIGILLGNGNGTFQSVVTYEVGGSGTTSIATADVNGDGILDLLVANGCATDCNNGTVSILLGNGDGTFRSPIVYDAGGIAPSAISLVDINGDGKPDIVVASQCAGYPCSSGSNDGVLGVLLGNGDGTFQSLITSAIPGLIASNQLAIADFDGDGFLDVASAGGFLLLGNGNGTFQPYITFFATFTSNDLGIAVADFNGDGHPDLALAGVGGTTIFLNQALYNLPSIVTLNSSPNPSGYGQTISLSATVTSEGAGVPTGTVTFTDGAVSLGAVSLTNGIASLTTSTLASAIHSITAAYSGDSRFGPSVSSPLLQIVNKAASATTVLSALNPSAFGQPITLSATVTPLYGGTVTGTATFYDGISALGTCNIVGNIAALSGIVLTTGQHTITAIYSGDTNFLGSTSASLTQNVNPAMSTTSLVASANPVAINQSVTYMATVTSLYGGAVSGAVNFKDGNQTTTVAIVGGIATLDKMYSAVGTHEITAIYTGDNNNAGSTSGTLREYVARLPVASKTVVTTSGSPSLVGQPVTFTATINSVYGTIPNGETVTFYDGAEVLGAETTTSDVATLTTSTLSAATHSIRAKYAGDSTFESSIGSVKQVVNRYKTTTMLTSGPNPSNYGEAVTLRAQVTTTAVIAPTGTVTFKSGTTTLADEALNTSGVATLNTTTLAVGNHSITATYNGNSANEKSISTTLSQTVNQAAVSMSLRSTPNPSAYGTPVELTARLVSNGKVPTGKVTFSLAGVTLGTSAIGETGSATFSTTKLSPGSDTVFATYAGDSDYSAATASVTQVVNGTTTSLSSSLDPSSASNLAIQKGGLDRRDGSRP